MDAKEAYRKTIDSDLERIHSAISAAAASGLHETIYRSDQPFKSDVTEALKSDGYVLTNYAPSPAERGDMYERSGRYAYAVGISWYGAA